MGGVMMSRRTHTVVGLAIVVAMYGIVGWVGSLFGVFAGVLTMLALIPVNIWIFGKLPKMPQQTEKEIKADAIAWNGFLEKLFWPVIPSVFVGWLLWHWIEVLGW